MTVAPSTAAASSAAETGSGHLHASPTGAAIAAASSAGEGGRSPLPSTSPASAQFSAFTEAGSPRIQLRAAKDGKSGEIEIYGDLDEYGFRKDAFVYAFRQLKDAETITVRIDSGGGNPFDAFFIHDALRNHQARIITRVDGVAASGASVIMMAGDDREIVENGWVMIHNAWGVAKGGADEFENYAGLMRKMNDRMAEVYSRATGMKITAIVEMMDAETWMTGAESLANKFATRVLAPIAIAAKFDVSRFNAPEAARRSLGLETAMSDNDTKKNADGTDAAPVEGQPNATEIAVEEAAKGFFAKLFSHVTTPADKPADAAPAKTAGDVATSAPDITAAVNAAVDKKLSALLSADSPIAQGLGAAFTAALTPVTQQLTALSTRVAADDAVHRAARIDANINLLVTSGRLTPAQAKSTRKFLSSAGASLTDEAINDYLADLAKSTPLSLAASAIGPVDEETGNVLEIPTELNPPPGSGLVVKNTEELRITVAARAKAEAAGGTAEEKYKVFVAEANKLLGQTSGRSTLAFSDSAPAN